MKTEITLENKAKLFAVYLGQKIILTGDYNRNLYNVQPYSLSLIIKGNNSTSLKLKPLSEITDEDAIEVAMLCFAYKEGYYITKTEILNDAKNEGHGLIKKIIDNKLPLSITAYAISGVIDFLRSKGYALPWMGLSVEQMVDFGWVKLKD